VVSEARRPDMCSCLGSPTRSPTCLVVLAKFHYRGQTRLRRRLFQKNLSKNPTFLKKPDDRFINKEEKKTLRVGEKYIREREQYGECNTLLPLK